MNRRDETPRVSLWPLAIALAAVIVVALLVFVLLALLRPSDGALAAGPRIAHLELWKCVHRQERSAWNDPGDPYFGGLQMGRWFMFTYASSRSSRHVSTLYDTKGTADRWTPFEQMLVADLAYRREGYSVRWLRGQWPPSVGVCF